MLRGWGLIFLLSLVVLVIGQNDYPCTCRDNAGDSFFVKVEARWPFPSVDGIDITNKPPPLTDFLTELNTDPTTFAGITTAEWQRRLNEATAQADDYTTKITNLSDTKAAYEKEKQITLDRWAAYRAQYERWENIRDPVSAINYLLSCDQIAARDRWRARIENYLAIWGKAYTSLANIFTVRKNILQKLKDLSQGLDDAVTNCVPSLTTPICSRVALAVTYIPTNSITTEIAALITDINSLLTGYQNSVMSEVINSTGLFVRTGDRDLADTIDRALLYDNYARIQNVASPTLDQIKMFLSQLVQSGDGRLARILERIKNLLLSTGDYQLTNTQFKCALDAPDVDRAIACEYTGTISGSGDLSRAVDRLVSCVRVVGLAITGASVVDVNTPQYDNQTNVYNIKLIWSRRILTLLHDIFLSSSVRDATADIRDIVAEAMAEFKSIKDTFLTATGTDLDDAIASAQQNYSDLIKATRDGISGVETNLQDRAVASDEYEAAREKLREDISKTQDNIAQLGFIWIRTKDSINNEDIADNQAVLTVLQNKIRQAEAELAACILEYLKAKKDAETNTDTTYQNLYDESKNSLLEGLNRTVIIVRQLKATHDSLSDDITTTIVDITGRIAALQDKITKVTNHVEAVISEIRTDWSNNISDLKQNIINIIRACRNRITLISIDLPDINDNKDSITIIVNINEDGYAGEVIDQVKELYCRIIRAALVACGQTTQVDVQASVSTKRATTGYTATISNPPSSAGTLVFSFATLVAFILVSTLL
jgi:ElaB/YqjD/DUF883 family membrane-anchored ribosome-binding protein